MTAPHSFDTQKVFTGKRVIFLCGPILDNTNQVRYQRAKLLAVNFQAAIISRGQVPPELRVMFRAAYHTRGRILAFLHALIIMVYLAVFRRYRVIYTSNEIYSIVVGFLATKLLGFLWIYDLWDHPSLQYSLSHSRAKGFKKILFERFIRKTYPIKLLEYLAMGKVVVATDTPAISKIIESGRNGLLVENNTESLGKAMNKILDMRRQGILESLRHEAKETAKRYSWKGINAVILSELKTLLVDESVS